MVQMGLTTSCSLSRFGTISMVLLLQAHKRQELQDHRGTPCPQMLQKSLRGHVTMASKYQLNSNRVSSRERTGESWRGKQRARLPKLVLSFFQCVGICVINIVKVENDFLEMGEKFKNGKYVWPQEIIKMNVLKVLKKNGKMVMIWVKDPACRTVLSHIRCELQAYSAAMSL